MWNKTIRKDGIEFEITLPHVGFHRQIGEFSEIKTTPEGEIITNELWTERKDDWLPTKVDGDFIASLMQPNFETGKFAGWIAPPKMGIDNKPGEFEYVKL